MKDHSFKSLEEAASWMSQTYTSGLKYKFQKGDEHFFELSKGAKNPFQFISDLLHIMNLYDIENSSIIPVSMDASSSAYQIMSYLLFNDKLAISTILLKSESGENEYNDIYNQLLVDIRESLDELLEDKKLADAVRGRLTRKLMKQIFMPLVYGKTKDSARTDIISILGEGGKDAYKLADALYQFWQKRYPSIFHVMTLVNEVGWFTSYFKRPVIYRNRYLTTIQDYVLSHTEKISFYNSVLKKKHQISLSIPTDKKDRAKTRRATFASFIHQKDADLVCNVISNCTSQNIPVYTVHDNFLTPAIHARLMPGFFKPS